MYSNTQTVEGVLFWRDCYPQQRVGEVERAPGGHHAHQQRDGDHCASDGAPQPEGSKLRRLHHRLRLHTVTQLTA